MTSITIALNTVILHFGVSLTFVLNAFLTFWKILFSQIFWTPGVKLINFLFYIHILHHLHDSHLNATFPSVIWLFHYNLFCDPNVEECFKETTFSYLWAWGQKKLPPQKKRTGSFETHKANILSQVTRKKELFKTVKVLSIFL